MQRWLLLLLVAGAFLLVGGIAGDALLVHNHLSGPALDEHCQSFLTAVFTNCILALVCVYCGVYLNIPNNVTSKSSHSATRHFCGWYSSAYLNHYCKPYSLINPGQLKPGFSHL